ncbi:hypothetical protein L207DRAFT_590416 [Hyaloscypha variabilis F]|uniref:Uncharacterized protein n=1 Tax=Hyaloscypha variabilis (strain UAMH 11265 / GT02V1 / F) TaxID=1149755 RepID=A0A2J6R2H6_HYAVF|nr:hypothetical protein L207DRAFT_590416 [Hyaloscypha variabilis F]
MAHANDFEKMSTDSYAELNSENNSNWSENDEYLIKIARYDMLFRITDASLLSATTDEGYLRYITFTLVSRAETPTKNTSIDETGLANGLVFTHFQLLEQNPTMQLGQCAMHFDMTRGPNDDAGNPLLVWRLVDDWDSKGYYEHQAKGYVKRYVGGGVVGHAVLSSAERERIKEREHLGVERAPKIQGKERLNAVNERLEDAATR